MKFDEKVINFINVYRDEEALKALKGGAVQCVY